MIFPRTTINIYCYPLNYFPHFLKPATYYLLSTYFKLCLCIYYVFA